MAAEAWSCCCAAAMERSVAIAAFSFAEIRALMSFGIATAAIEEERKAYEEYDDVQGDLGDALAKLTASMPMSNADRRDLEGLMNVQIDRMRELTRDWASGDFTDEEIAERFMAERREHRQAAIALLGQERIPAYRKFLQQGGVGGRFSFYTAPWEEWSVEAGED